MVEHALWQIGGFLPWHEAFDGSLLALLVVYVCGQIVFCLGLRRVAMAIPGPERMCNPLGLWVLAVPGVGALASFGVLRQIWHAAIAALDAHHVPPPDGVARGFAVAYGGARLLMLVPGMVVPALALQLCAAVGFLLRLQRVARLLRTPDVRTVPAVIARTV
jgi:hypothetical protein